uniref:Putative secreted peptide n=1 Tax=Anopheles braziliensis TaxID=58242 RepID=A0A2M3ZXL0_9DIPT
MMVSTSVLCTLVSVLLSCGFTTATLKTDNILVNTSFTIFQIPPSTRVASVSAQLDQKTWLPGRAAPSDDE